MGTAATPGPLCQPRVIVKMIMEKQIEFRLAGETKVLWENLPQRHFCPSQNPTWPDPGLNPGRRGGKPPTNRLGYGAAGATDLRQLSNNFCVPQDKKSKKYSAMKLLRNNPVPFKGQLLQIELPPC
jgi:hypothetical protein